MISTVVARTPYRITVAFNCAIPSEKVSEKNASLFFFINETEEFARFIIPIDFGKRRNREIQRSRSTERIREREILGENEIY